MSRYAKYKPPGFTLGEQAQGLLRQEGIPAPVKTAITLACRGGRQRRCRCRCGAPGIHCQIATSDALWGVESPANTTLKVFWVCPSCKAREDAKEPSS